MLDPMLRQCWSGYLQLPTMLDEPFTLLDAGCMCAFLYHHLKKYFTRFTYTGMDRWKEALVVAHEIAPEIELIEADMFEAKLKQDYDYIVISNIGFKKAQGAQLALKYACHARRNLIFIEPDGKIITLSAPAGARHPLDDRAPQRNIPA